LRGRIQGHANAQPKAVNIEVTGSFKPQWPLHHADGPDSPLHEWQEAVSIKSLLNVLDQVEEELPPTPADEGSHTPEWSKPIAKKKLREMLGISANTLNSRLIKGDTPAHGKIRYQAPAHARKIQVAVADLPAEVQTRFRKSAKQ
jgi:hypothetical protein